MIHRTLVLELAVLILVISPLPAQQGGRGGPPSQSPASRVPPKTETPQSYPADQIQAGESRFISQCGFCHGRDAQGGESGPDLTRSLLVAGDVRGDKLGPLILAGRPARIRGVNLSPRTSPATKRERVRSGPDSPPCASRP